MACSNKMTTFINDIGSFGGQCSIVIDESLGLQSFRTTSISFDFSKETSVPIAALRPECFPRGTCNSSVFAMRMQTDAFAMRSYS